MSLILAIVALALAGLALVAMVREKRLRDQRRMEQHSITAEELHSLLASHPETLLLDVRQPLDLLAAGHSRRWPWARRPMRPSPPCCRWSTAARASSSTASSPR